MIFFNIRKMQKYVLIGLIHIGSIHFFHAQLINIGGNYNIDLYKPYSQQTRDSADVYGEISSFTYNTTFHLNLVENQKLKWNLGFSYKQAQQFIGPMIRGYYIPDHSTGGQEYKTETLDLYKWSHSVGIYNAVGYKLKSKEKLNHEIGMSNELYLYEFFKTDFFYAGTENKFKNKFNTGPHEDGFKGFRFASTNVTIYYRLNWKVIEHFSLSSRISFGTNIYSYWSEFKNYAWVGVGLEIGLVDRPVFRPQFKEKLRKFHKRSFHGRTEEKE